MQRQLVQSAKPYIYIGVGARDLYIDEAHMALDIFRFAVFFSFLKPPAWFYVPHRSIFLLAGLC